jgi:peptide deformylase
VTVVPVRLLGDPVLRTPAQDVASFDAELRRLVRNLDDTLDDQRGSGLAAPQVGVGLRVFVFHDDDVSGHLVNPVLSFPDEEEQDGPEGCLSMPGLYFDTKRRLNVVARGRTVRGDPVQVVGTGSLARCLQHEADHLDGVLFIDRMDARRRKAAMRAIRAASWFNSASPPAVKVSPHPAGPLHVHGDELEDLDGAAGHGQVRVALEDGLDFLGRAGLQDRVAADAVGARRAGADMGGVRERRAEVDDGVADLGPPGLPGLQAGLHLLGGRTGHLLTGGQGRTVKDHEFGHRVLPGVRGPRDGPAADITPACRRLQSGSAAIHADVMISAGALRLPGAGHVPG